MSLKAQAIKNVSATWLALLVQAVVGFFLAPFILHRLGNEAFSVWVLVFALTGYFGLLDCGIRSSIVKYTAAFIATHDDDQLSRYLSTSLAFYSLVGFFVLILTVAGFFCLHLMFRVPSSLLTSARILLLLSGASLALTFPLNVFSGALEGLQKFSWLQLTQIGIALLRACLIVVALRNGGGLLALGTITVAMNLLSSLVFMGMAWHALPVRLNLGGVDGKVYRKMASYGAFAFAVVGAEKLRFQSDSLVIGALLSATAITYFSIAARLVEYSSYAVRSMSQIFTPMSSQFHAVGDLESLRRTFLTGNRASALTIFPLCVVLLILGKPIIQSWVGVSYVSSYPLLVVLIVPRTLYLAQSTSTRILLGMGRHRLLASVLLLEGVTNLLLSVFLAHRFGIVGVAWGTAIPLACTSLVFLPRHLCRVLDLPLWTFLDRAYRLPLAIALLLASVLWFLSHVLPTHSAAGLLTQITSGGILYGALLAWTLLSSRFDASATWHGVVESLTPKRSPLR
jgi:O-antigen/teichoic acid export membrane protein